MLSGSGSAVEACPAQTQELGVSSPDCPPASRGSLAHQKQRAGEMSQAWRTKQVKSHPQTRACQQQSPQLSGQLQGLPSCFPGRGCVSFKSLTPEQGPAHRHVIGSMGGEGILESGDFISSPDPATSLLRDYGQVTFPL